MNNDKLRAPFPWFGGKSRVADLVWQRFGDVPNYAEPFYGSGAVLLGRPNEPRIETVNDLDCYVSNFWRALQAKPDDVARWADWPVNEADLHARHAWLLFRAEFRARMHAEPDYYDAKIAGWWVWGICQWIGSGWCSQECYDDGIASQQLPHLGNAGRGVHRPSQQRPHLGPGANGEQSRIKNLDYMRLLADRLRRVRVCCGDWSRILGESPTGKLGLTGVFLDPPYSAQADRDDSLYGVDDLSVAHDVREWCVEHGDNPLLRIALCGYRGEHDSLEDRGWSAIEWKAAGGYGSQGNGRGRDNSKREVVWFSPHCVDGIAKTLPMF